MERNELFEAISAYIDGELDDNASAEVRRALESDAEARRFYESLRDNAAQVAALPRHNSPDSILNGIRHQLEREALLDRQTETPRRPRRRWLSPRGLSLAASLLIVLAAGVWAGIYLSNNRNADRLAERDRSMNDPPALASTTESKRDERTLRMVQPTRAGERSAGAESRSSELSFAMAPAGEGLDATRLLNVEQKLKVGTDTTLLQQHRFENEPMRIQVAVADDNARRGLESRVASLLRARQITNLAEVDDQAPPAAFYQAGRIGVNYDDTQTEQILVRIPQSQLPELVADVQADGAAQAVDMRINDLRIDGAAQVQQVVAQLGNAAAAPAPPINNTDADKATTGGQAANGSLMKGFLEVFRLNQEMLAPANRGDDAMADAETAEPTARDRAEESDANESPATDRARAARRRAAMADATKEKKDDSPSGTEEAPDDQATAEREEPSLVKRRLEAAQARQSGSRADDKGDRFARRVTTPVPTESSPMDLAIAQSEPMITLVLELIVQHPTSSRPPATNANEAQPTRTQPGRPTPEESGNNNAGSIR